MAAIGLLIALTVVVLLHRRRAGGNVAELAYEHAPGPTFEARWPGLISRDEWHPLWIYMFAGWDGYRGYREDVRRRIGTIAAAQEIALSDPDIDGYTRGIDISIVPDVAGVDFNPPSQTMRWLEPWHSVEFRMRLTSDQVAAAGKIAVFASGILVCEIRVIFTYQNSLTGEYLNAAKQWSRNRDDDIPTLGARSYRSIFVSYSHRDAAVVDMLEKAYRALGDSYLRDVRFLRSGEAWDPSVLHAIELCDIFQLCWSDAASASPHVEREWRHALSLQRRSFVRPVYWQTPLPSPPRELASIHFAFLPLLDR